MAILPICEIKYASYESEPAYGPEDIRIDSGNRHEYILRLPLNVLIIELGHTSSKHSNRSVDTIRSRRSEYIHPERLRSIEWESRLDVRCVHPLAACGI